MADNIVCVLNEQNEPIKLLKWKVRENSTVSVGRIILVYQLEKDAKNVHCKLKCTRAGIIKKIFEPEGAIVCTGKPLYELEPCNHPTIMNDMCAECGADLRKDEVETVASVPMVHAIPDLKVSEEEAKIIGKADSERLIQDRKLVLLVDLDQTLIHTTNDNIPPNIKDVYHFQLYGPHSPWYHTRLRPGTHQFLKNICSFYELHICTFGTRNYAHTIAMFLDKDQKFFSNRILSRDECFDPTSKKANLKALFPCGDNMVCIIDDREDVWSNALNLIHVKPYHFFRHTGDINAPPGLDKHEQDEVTGVDLTNILTKKNGNTIVNGAKTKNNLKVDTEIFAEKMNGKISDTGKDNVNEGKLIINKTDDDGDLSQKTNVSSEASDIDESENKNIDETGVSEADVAGDVDIEKKDVISDVDVEKKDDNDVEKKSICDEENTKASCSDNTVINNETSAEKADEIKNVPSDKCNGTDEQNEVILQNENEAKEPSSNKESDLVEVEDPDSYLLYLETILKQIHKAFYEKYDVMESGEVPDLKQVIPAVRSEILKGTKLCFSGLVPTHVKLEQSKAYLIARSLGAEVTQALEPDTTHLVAVRPGTAKVNSGKRRKNLKIVTPDWLWCCAERWEHAEERVFHLDSKGSKNRHPPPHCSSPEHAPEYPVHSNPAVRKRTPSGRFMDTINPLMSFSSADIADMDKEVEDILDDESESSDEDDVKIKKDSLFDVPNDESSSSSSSEESMNADYPHGYKRNHEEMTSGYAEEEQNNSEEEELPSTKFRRGECLEEMEEWESQDTENSLDAPDEVDDGEWNMMGAALEREFLSND